jgi:threonine dehydrogenase-like Zn-dependent dehydrogenase
MKAWRFYALNDMRLDEIPYPAPKPSWVTLKVRVVQPSVTEAIRAKGGNTAGIENIKKAIAEQAPIQLFGHELCGDVVELGGGVTSLKIGDRVTARSRMPCHKCELCLAGLEERCRKGPTIGQHMPGAFAEYVTVPAEAVALVPPELSDNEAACMQPLSGCVADVKIASIRQGDTVVVMGQGVMGLYVMQLAQINGAGTVIGIDVKKENLRVSKELGSDYQVNGAETDPVEAVRDLTHGFGPDIVFDAAGGPPTEGLSGTRTLEQAIDIIGDNGKIVQLAHLGNTIQFPSEKFRVKGISYLFPQPPTAGQMDYALRAVATGRVRLKPTLTHILEGLDKVPESFEITGNKGKYGGINPAQVVVSR